MPRKSKTVIPIPAEIVPKGRDAAAVELKRMVAQIVEERVAEALASELSSTFEPFFQPKHISDEIKRRQTVHEQRKWTYFYADWGCLRCGTTQEPHASLGMCRKCYGLITMRLRISLRNHSAAEEPAPTFVDTSKMAREALAPSIEALAKRRVK